MIKGGYNEVNPGTVALILLKVAGVLLDRFAPLLGHSGSFRTVFGSFWIVSYRFFVFRIVFGSFRIDFGSFPIVFGLVSDRKSFRM